jgi:hypothetical protein
MLKMLAHLVGALRAFTKKISCTFTYTTTSTSMHHHHHHPTSTTTTTISRFLSAKAEQ